MARKGLDNIKTPPKPRREVKTITCTECNQERKTTEFYKSYTSASGVVPFCKECIVDKCLSDDKEAIDVERFKKTMQLMDRPYIHHLFVKNANRVDTARAIVGYYLKDIAMTQYKTQTWKDSLFETHEEKLAMNPNFVRNYIDITPEQRIDLTDKWGNFPDDILLRFEKKFQQMSKGYPLLTVMHEEALTTYCKLQVKYEIAIEEGNTQEAKLYGDLAKQARADAKLNPNQLKKEDFQAGGANSFGEIARLVSKRDGVCQLPLRYYKKPTDHIDYAIYQFIAYERALRGLPEPNYDEIYEWYLEDIAKYEKKHGVKFSEEPKYIEIK